MRPRLLLFQRSPSICFYRVFRNAASKPPLTGISDSSIRRLIFETCRSSFIIREPFLVFEHFSVSSQTHPANKCRADETVLIQTTGHRRLSRSLCDVEWPPESIGKIYGKELMGSQPLIKSMAPSMREQYARMLQMYILCHIYPCV